MAANRTFRTSAFALQMSAIGANSCAEWYQSSAKPTVHGVVFDIFA
jgi:hypothetical protein